MFINPKTFKCDSYDINSTGHLIPKILFSTYLVTANNDHGISPSHHHLLWKKIRLEDGKCIDPLPSLLT